MSESIDLFSAHIVRPSASPPQKIVLIKKQKLNSDETSYIGSSKFVHIESTDLKPVNIASLLVKNGLRFK